MSPWVAACRRAAQAASIAAVVSACASAARADDILVFRKNQGDFSDQAATEAGGFFTSLGHSVTVVQGLAVTLPALDTFDQVYVIQGLALAQADANALVAYVKAGGRLYVTGENPNAQAGNTVLQDQVVNRLVDAANIVVGTGATGTDMFTFTGTDKVGFASTPNALAAWRPIVPGLLDQVPPANAIATQAGGGVGAAVFAREDLVADAAGCLVVAMDADFWYRHELVQPPDLAIEAEIRDIAENLHAFLADCGDTDGDGLLDADETALGTSVDDPDSDDDGLCDGTIGVTPAAGAPCVAGENAKSLQDTDRDGTLDALDPDDDNDSLPTSLELSDVGKYGNPDDDGVPAWLDLDSDGDRVFDSTEGVIDSDGDGVPDYLDPLAPSTTTTTSGGGDGGGGSASTTGAGGNPSTSSGAGGEADVPSVATGGGIFCAAGVRDVHGSGPIVLVGLAALGARRRARRRR